MSTEKDKKVYSFAERLRAAMAAREMKQVPLAQLVGVTQPTISNWLKGEIMPEAGQVVAISKALGMSTDYLLMGLEGIDKPPEVMREEWVPEMGVWRRRAEEAERRLALIRGRLREVLNETASTPPPKPAVEVSSKRLSSDELLEAASAEETPGGGHRSPKAKR